MPSTTPLALFVGMPGLKLSADEMAFLREANPYGLFLFRRNLDTPDQIRRLCAQFREAVGRADAPVFIDQEGGRVQRLDNGNWPMFRSLGDFGALARKDLDLGKRAIRLSHRAMGAMMVELTINSGTSPVVDLVRASTSDMLGDRCLGDDPELVAALGREAFEGLAEVGAIPVVKHVPGYGHVVVNAHFEKPVVDAPIEDMRRTDFHPFIALKDAPWAMVAHAVYTAIDPDRVATVSSTVCKLIREDIGYDGVLITDCLTMDALSGPWPDRVAGALEAGYDIALLSQGMVPEGDDMLAANYAGAKAAKPLSSQTQARIARGAARLGRLEVDIAAAHAEVEDIFNNAGIV